MLAGLDAGRCPEAFRDSTAPFPALAVDAALQEMGRQPRQKSIGLLLHKLIGEVLAFVSVS
jgi:hypothetical protein